MQPTSWAILALATAGALAVVLYIYRKRELPGRGRALLAMMRWTAVAVLLLVVFGAEFPAPGTGLGSRSVVLLDASLSMAVPVAPGSEETRWDLASRQARTLAGGRPVFLFGDASRPLHPDSLNAVSPQATTTRLLPALQAASEAGARHAVVLTDGGLDDVAEVERWLPRLGLGVEFRNVTGAPVPNRALMEVDAPAWAEAGEPVELRVGVTTTDPGFAGDSVRVLVRREGDQVVAQTRLALAGPGRVATATLEFTPEAPAGAGEAGALVRYDIALEPGDEVPDDDRRTVYIHVSDQPAGVALVSFVPDWEPRFLYPVLQQALGVPVHGYLAGGGRFIRLGAGTDAARLAEEAEVRRAVRQADLVVFHGLGPNAPGWAREAARSARRLLVLPARGATDVGLAFSLPPAAPGDWYLSAEAPSSPITALLADLRTRDLPPLTSARPVRDRAGGWIPFEAQRDRRGAGSPVALVGESDDRRWAVATADGYWRWAFRGGESMQMYRRLWGGVAGWLLRDHERADAASPIRPVSWAHPRSEPVRWLAPGLELDSMAVRVTDAAGDVVTDTIVPVDAAAAASAALGPGQYTFEITGFVTDGGQVESGGPLSIESHAAEFSTPAVALDGMEAAGEAAAAASDRRVTVPLHTLPWPYFAVVLLLCGEWVLRRRWGLR